MSFVNKLVLYNFIIGFIILPLSYAAEEPHVLKDVIVTAVKPESEVRKLKVFESPDPVTIITREQIDEFKPKSIGDLFFNVPGVDITDDGTYWARKPVIRGLRGDRVIIIVDGARLKVHLGMGGAYLSLIDPDTVEQIEIIKGPKSVLYGSDAIGGVIKITTRNAGKQAEEGLHLSGKLDAGYSTVNSMQSGSLQVSGSTGNLRMFGALSYRKAGDYDLPHGGKEDSGFEEYNTNMNLSYSFWDDHEVKASYSKHKVWDVDTPPFFFNVNGEFIKGMMPLKIMDPIANLIDCININTETDAPFIGVDFHIGFDKMIYEKYALDYSISNIASFFDKTCFSLYYVDTPMDMFMYTAPAIFGKKILEIDMGTSFTVETTGGRWENNLHFKDHSLTCGIDAYRDDANGDDFGFDLTFLIPFSISLALPPLDAELQSIDAFIQDEWKPFEFLTLVLGCRYDYTESENFADKRNPLQDGINKLFGIDDLNVNHNDHAFTYSFQSIFHLTDTVNLLAGYTTGFRVPNLMERYLIGSVGIATSIANPYLEPEESRNIEVGLKGYSPGKWDWKITGYYTELDNMIVSKMLGANMIQFVNAKEAEIWGAEGSASYYMGENWSVNTTIAYSKGENKATDSHLNNVPPLNGTMSLRYQRENLSHWINNFWVQFEARLVDRHDRIEVKKGPDDLMADSMYQMIPGFGDVETPGFALFHLRAGFSLPEDILGQKLTLLFAVENLLDKEYTEPLSFQRTQPGRNFKFFITLNL